MQKNQPHFSFDLKEALSQEQVDLPEMVVTHSTNAKSVAINLRAQVVLVNAPQHPQSIDRFGL